MSCNCNDPDTGSSVALLTACAIDGLISVDVTGLTVTLGIDMAVEALHAYNIWLSDSATDPTPSVNLPNGTDPAQWEGYTNSSGERNIVFTHSGASRTWYAHGYFLQLNTSAAITVGV